MNDLFPFLAAAAVIFVIGIGYASAWPSTADATSALHSSGYTETEITSASALTFKCSDSDSMQYGFSALNPSGQPVSGTVCCGVWKGCTVRF